MAASVIAILVLRTLQSDAGYPKNTASEQVPGPLKDSAIRPQPAGWNTRPPQPVRRHFYRAVMRGAPLPPGWPDLAAAARTGAARLGRASPGYAAAGPQNHALRTGSGHRR